MIKKKSKEFVIKVVCAKCNVSLYKYRKRGAGSLIRCYVDCIAKDYTNGDLKCHKCNQKFARLIEYRNRPAHKIIQGKIIIKGHCGRQV